MTLRCLLLLSLVLTAGSAAAETTTSTMVQNIFTRPPPGQETLGPTWLNELDEVPNPPPGRKWYRPDAPIDAVYLQGGDVIRGHLVNEDFNEHLAIVDDAGNVHVLKEDLVLKRTKEKALLRNRTNRSHQRQVGILLLTKNTGLFCLSLSGGCTGASGLDTSSSPFLGGFQIAITPALSGALELAIGGELYKSPIVDKIKFDPAIGIRYYMNVFDPVKFVRTFDVFFTLGKGTGFGFGIETLSGIQLDMARNVGVLLVVGPRTAFLPSPTISLALSIGLQARFP